MGLIHVTVTLRAGQHRRKKFEAEFLVNSGATDSTAPASGLVKAGIPRRGRMAYELADGTTVEYDFGLAEIEFMGELTSGRVIFGPEGCEPILGVTALESVGIVIDPASQRLKRLPAVPLKGERRFPTIVIPPSPKDPFVVTILSLLTLAGEIPHAQRLRSSIPGSGQGSCLISRTSAAFL
jgi:clan AA aspartic protease